MPKKHIDAPASIIRRIIAFVIDLFLIDLIIVTPFSGLLSGSIPSDYSKINNMLMSNQDMMQGVVSVIIVITVLSVFYFAICEKILGQTLGKMLMKIKVVSEAGEITLLQGIIRSLFLIPVFPFIMLWVIDPVAMGFTKDNKRLSEILSKTKTIQRFEIR